MLFVRTRIDRLRGVYTMRMNNIVIYMVQISVDERARTSNDIHSDSKMIVYDDMYSCVMFELTNISSLVSLL